MNDIEKNQLAEEDAKTDKLIADIKSGDEEKPEETPESKDEKSKDAAGNSDEEKKKAAEDDKKKSEEEGKAPEEKSAEEIKKDEEKAAAAAKPEEKKPEEWDKKFKDQNKNFQKTLKERSEKNYELHKELVKNSPDRLLELSNSSDDEDVKLANRLSKEIYNLPLKDALATIKKSRSDAGEEEETREERDARIKNETERETVNVNALESFKEKHPVLDPSKEEFDKEVGEKFDKKFATLSGDGKMLKEDFKESLDDAYFIATKDLKIKAEKKDADDAQKKIAEAGAGGGEKKLDLNEKKDDIDRLCDDITEIANSKK